MNLINQDTESVSDQTVANDPDTGIQDSGDANLITADMIDEENKAHEESQKEFEARLWETRQNEFSKEQAEQSRKRLNFLVERAGIYSKWLAEKLEERQSELVNPNQPKKVKQTETRPTPKAEDKQEPDAVTQDPVDSDDEEALLARQPVTRRKSKRVAKLDPGKKRKDESIQSTKPAKKGRGKLGVKMASSTTTSSLVIPPRTGRQPALVTGCTMREYQLVGMEWLISLYDNGLNGILADEMGLGKTLQTLAFLAHLREMGTTGPFLIVAPLSTLANWVTESERFTPTIPVVLYHGNPTERMYIRNHKLQFEDSNYPIVVTSYEICMKDRKHLQNVLWKYIVVDEGHRIKNLNCRLIRELKCYNSANRLLLTGTPLQNNLSELWSLLNFLMPDIFDDLTAFEGWFEFGNDLSTFTEGGDGDQSNENTHLVHSLHQILKPFLLRRVKTEVAADLPKKREYMLFAPLAPKQKLLYDAALRGELASVVASSLEENMMTSGVDVESKENEPVATETSLEVASVSQDTRSSRNRNRVDYNEVSDKQYFKSLDTQKMTNSKRTADADPKAYIQKLVKSQNLQSLIVQLRKICNHPYLFDIDTDEDFAHVEGTNESATLPKIVSWSGKMMLLERLLPTLFEKGHKVLIFSQMTRMLDILSDWFEYAKKWRYCRIDGSVSIHDRRAQIQAFNTSSDINIFLLSTRAGGLGINLTAADTVIIFDSDWNPQADLQAQDRVHRIGQSKPVVVYRLVTSHSVEEKILDKAKSKRRLEKLVIHKEQFKGSESYYKSNKMTNMSDLAIILTAEEGVSVHAKDEVFEVDEKNITRAHLTRVLGDDELERITDRSPESYEGTNQAESSHVRVVQEDAEQDANDILNTMN